MSRNNGDVLEVFIFLDMKQGLHAFDSLLKNNYSLLPVTESHIGLITVV